MPDVVILASRIPDIVAAICTKDRTSSAITAIRSVLNNSHANFRLIVIDQGIRDDTQEAAAEFFADPRFVYTRAPADGAGPSRNRALRYAASIGSPVVAYTDDDCTVPGDWLEKIETVFLKNPQVAVVFCNVSAAPHDPSKGFVPAYMRTGELIVTNMRGKCRACGIGAGMSVRVETLEKIGGFDDLLGPGTRFQACEDGDVAVRALLAGYHVLETDAVVVEHYGFRTWDEGKKMSRRDWLGIGAAYMKPLRAGRGAILIVFFYELFARALWPPLKQLLTLKRPQGAMRAFAFIEGAFTSLAFPIDNKTLCFLTLGNAVADRVITSGSRHDDDSVSNANGEA